MSGAAPRDLVYYGIGALFYLAPRLLYALQVQDAARYRHRPSTLVVVNHKRDLDSVIIPPTLYFNGVRPKRPLWFAGREDMFVRGFLAGYQVVPRWLRRLLHEMDLTAVLGALRVLPVRRFPERTMAEALHEVLRAYGDRPLAEVLSPQEAEPLARLCGPGATLSAALAWRFHDRWQRRATLQAFAPRWRETLRERQRAVVAGQMRALADVLDRGENLYLAPEGVISPDGRLQRFRSGLRQILSLVRVKVRLQPVCVVYDFMRPGPLRVFLTVGEEVSPGASPAESEQAARRALAALHVMTCTQVASHLLWDLLGQGHTTVEVSRFVRDVLDFARTLAREGLRVDPALLEDRGQARVYQWLSYATRRGLLVRRGETLHPGADRLLGAPATHWGNPVHYAANELLSVREALGGEERPAACAPEPAAP
ncbi:MAG: hypothetical protein QN152_02540 [Armatimonadota bacterium]|nr:hypothetical protein [Armatimonadota bacterium]MDR7428074.1 hypothetical protein [Armatimonadota bacterium]MDR7464592.1 hypothetical protein [Armatimonadota bacterium]MDR7469676.1 hypothetical protein [Armatimonadota bacterium]MDR7475888.1 hypothetical protein [Armatimonadota bacterium]